MEYVSWDVIDKFVSSDQIHTFLKDLGIKSPKVTRESKDVSLTCPLAKATGCEVREFYRFDPECNILGPLTQAELLFVSYFDAGNYPDLHED